MLYHPADASLLPPLQYSTIGTLFHPHPSLGRPTVAQGGRLVWLGWHAAHSRCSDGSTVSGLMMNKWRLNLLLIHLLTAIMKTFDKIPTRGRRRAWWNRHLLLRRCSLESDRLCYLSYRLNIFRYAWKSHEVPNHREERLWGAMNWQRWVIMQEVIEVLKYLYTY